MSGIKVVNNY